MHGDRTLGGTPSLFGDAIIVFLLLNEGRRRFVMWVYGAPREDSGLLTVSSVGPLIEGLHTGVRVIAAAAVPSFAATAMGGAAVKEAAHGLAGTWSRTAPAFGSLIVFAFAARWLVPGLRASFHDAREGVHEVEIEAREFLEFVGGGKAASANERW